MSIGDGARYDMYVQVNVMIFRCLCGWESCKY